MAYGFVDEHDLNRMQEKFKEAGQKLDELRQQLKARTPQRLFLKSFATAEWQLEELAAGLKACVDNISVGDKKLAKITQAASRIHAKSRAKAAPKPKRPNRDK